MKIDQVPDTDYESARISQVGIVDRHGLEGMLVLRSDDGKEFQMRAFSGEVAQHIAGFTRSPEGTVPTIYNMLEEICENGEMVLVKVKVYDIGEMLRANLYFTGRRDMILRNYRASDALALATLYNVPILIRKRLLKLID